MEFSLDNKFKNVFRSTSMVSPAVHQICGFFIFSVHSLMLTNMLSDIFHEEQIILAPHCGRFSPMLAKAECRLEEEQVGGVSTENYCFLCQKEVDVSRYICMLQSHEVPITFTKKRGVTVLSSTYICSSLFLVVTLTVQLILVSTEFIYKRKQTY